MCLFLGVEEAFEALCELLWFIQHDEMPRLSHHDFAIFQFCILLADSGFGLLTGGVILKSNPGAERQRWRFDFANVGAQIVTEYVEHPIGSSHRVGGNNSSRMM